MITRYHVLIVAGSLLLFPAASQAQRITTWTALANSSLSAVSPSTSLIGANPATDMLLAPVAQETRLVPRSAVTLGFGGLVGGALGFFAGGFAGVAVCGCDSGGEGYDELEAFFWGAAVGTAITIPLGVHMANRSKGNYWTALAVSGGISVIGLAAAYAVNDDASGAIVLLIPVSQIISSVLIERGM
jgi:hypothetical protein